MSLEIPLYSVPFIALATACSADFGDAPVDPPGASTSNDDATADWNEPTDPTTATATATANPTDPATATPPAADPTATPATDPAPTPAPLPASDPDLTPETCAPAFATGPSRCRVSPDLIECDHNDGNVGGRLVVWQVPVGTPPPGGWPAVIVFQGSVFGPDMTWTGTPDMPFGGFNQVALQAMLLDNGFAVVAPAVSGVAWATNFPAYELSADHRFIPLLLDEIATGNLGEIDTSRLYATGISSGGYMTSRMAVSYPGSFTALAIESGSYATCSNLLCSVPPDLPADHPPTLFLHGQNDVAVPMVTAEQYRDRLVENGIETDMVVDPNVGHQWLDVAPAEITCWFATH